MAKKKSSSFLKKNGVFILLVLALAIIPFCALQGLKNYDYNLFNLAFGKTLVDVGSLGGSKIKFSFALTLAIFIPTIGCLLSFVLPGKFIKGLVIAACFIAAAVLFFITPQLAQMEGTVLGIGGTSSFKDCALGVGAIVCGSIACAGGLGGLAYAFI